MSQPRRLHFACHAVTRTFVVQELLCKICPVGPDQRVEFGVNSKLLKRGEIPQWLKDWPLQSRLEIDLAGSAVTESKPYHVTANVARLDDVVVHDPHSKGAIRVSGWPCFASCQFSSNSGSWRFIHSSTSFNALGEVPVDRTGFDFD